MIWPYFYYSILYNAGSHKKAAVTLQQTDRAVWKWFCLHRLQGEGETCSSVRLLVNKNNFGKICKSFCRFTMVEGADWTR